MSIQIFDKSKNGANDIFIFSNDIQYMNIIKENKQEETITKEVEHIIKYSRLLIIRKLCFCINKYL